MLVVRDILALAFRKQVGSRISGVLNLNVFRASTSVGSFFLVAVATMLEAQFE